MALDSSDPLDSSIVLRYVVAGAFKQETILPISHPPVINQPGGSALYAAAGISIWDHGIGLIGHIGRNYPAGWVSDFLKQGWDTTGVRQLTSDCDHRAFFAYQDLDTPSTDSPINHFTSANLPFPKELIGYSNPSESIDSRVTPTASTLIAGDVPDEYLDATAAHLCPLDYHSHSLLPSVFRQGHISTITLEPSPSYMNPAFLDLMPDLLSGLTAFLPSEKNALKLFQGRTTDQVEIAEALAIRGSEIIVIHRGGRGCLVYDHRSHSRWIIPAYPSNAFDPTGSADAFCGGFLAGFRMTYDPLQAALHASISRAFCVESSGPKYLLDVMPGLARARLESLKGLIRKI